MPVVTQADLLQRSERLATSLTELRATCALVPEPFRSILAERLNESLGDFIAFQTAYAEYVRDCFGDINLATAYLGFDIHATKAELQSEIDDLRKRLE